MLNATQLKRVTCARLTVARRGVVGHRAHAKRRQDSQDDGEVDELIYHIDQGWSSDEFLNMAEKLQKSLSERSRADDEASGDGFEAPGVWNNGEEDDEDDNFSLEGILDELKGGIDRPEIVFSTEGEWEVTGLDDDDHGDDDDQDHPSIKKGAGSATASSEFLDDGWGVDAEDDSTLANAIELKRGRPNDSFKLDFRPTLEEVDPSTMQLSSKQLLKDWAADKPLDTKSLSVLEKGGGQALESLRPHQLRRLDQQQAEAYKEEQLMTPAEQRKRRKASQRHQGYLKIIAGTAAGKRLYSPADERTRPMMEKVRGALFSMLLSQSGGTGMLPAGSRWLDMFAGTGAVGLEGLSRGCQQAHFVEMDPWVIKKVLDPNIKSTCLETHSVVHAMKAEDFLRRAQTAPMFAGGAFDFISVTPPYMMVSYPELYQLLDASPLVHDRSVVIIEYAKQNLKDIRARIGPLQMVKDRKYGRTFLAIYANLD